jgi:hypothetical protein
LDDASRGRVTIFLSPKDLEHMEEPPGFIPIFSPDNRPNLNAENLRAQTTSNSGRANLPVRPNFKEGKRSNAIVCAARNVQKADQVQNLIYREEIFNQVPGSANFPHHPPSIT